MRRKLFDKFTCRIYCGVYQDCVVEHAKTKAGRVICQFFATFCCMIIRIARFIAPWILLNKNITESQVLANVTGLTVRPSTILVRSTSSYDLREFINYSLSRSIKNNGVAKFLIKNSSAIYEYT